MTNEHPITPSRALVNNWAAILVSRSDYDVFIEAAQWGANQELEACCEWMRNAPFGLALNTSVNQLRAARRPKPPSLKEQALAVLDDCSDRLDAAHENIIRLALEALPQ